MTDRSIAQAAEIRTRAEKLWFAPRRKPSPTVRWLRANGRMLLALADQIERDR